MLINEKFLLARIEVYKRAAYQRQSPTIRRRVNHTSQHKSNTKHTTPSITSLRMTLVLTFKYLTQNTSSPLESQAATEVEWNLVNLEARRPELVLAKPSW